MRARELAYCGVFGAAALLLPVVFHLVRLGRAFLPMYLPLVALACFVRWRAAALTALVVPLLSGWLTGMPPFYPPVAPAMAAELVAVTGLVAAGRRWLPRLPLAAVVLAALAVGRVLSAGMFYTAAAVMELPAKFVAGISFLSGWPGVLLMVAVVPAVARVARKESYDETGSEDGFF